MRPFHALPVSLIGPGVPDRPAEATGFRMRSCFARPGVCSDPIDREDWGDAVAALS